MRLSIRNRITIGNIALLAVALLLFAAAARGVIGRVMLREVDRTLREQALASLRRPGPPPPGRGPGFGPGRHRPPGEGPEEGRPFGPPWERGGGPRPEDGGPPFPLLRGRGGGGPFFGAPRLGTDALLPPRNLSLDEGGPSPWSERGFTTAARAGRENWQDGKSDDTKTMLRVFSLPVRDDQEQVVGVVQTAASLSETQAALRAVTYSLALLLPVIVLMAGIGGVALTRQALTPVRRLTEAAARIEPSALSERLPEPGGRDEFDALAKMLNGMLARLEDAFIRQKRFTAHASHELRTPLAVIKTATSLLTGATALPPSFQQDALRGADQAVDRANRLIADLLFLTRTENGALPVRPAPINIADTLNEAVRNAQKVYSGDTPPATITVDADASLTAWTDRDLLLRLIGNLLDNALRYTPPDGTIRVRAVREAGILRLSVADSGCGILPEHLSRLGEPFYRPDVARARADGGVGLGLSLCRAIAAALGGSLTLESAVGKGATATVLLDAPSAPR